MALLHGGAAEEQAALGEAAAGLVHGHRGHIRAGSHGGHGQLVAEIEVGAVGLVGQAEHAVVVGHFGDGLDVRADAVIGGVVHQHGLGVGMFFNGVLHVLPAHTQGDAQPVVAGGVHIDGHRAAEHHGTHDAAVDVPGQDDFLPPLGHGENHGLHRGGGAAHHQKGVGCAKGLGGQLLGLPDDGDRVAEVVQGLHGVDVHGDALFPQQLGQLRVAPAPLMAGDVKGHHPAFFKFLKRLINWGALL